MTTSWIPLPIGRGWKHRSPAKQRRDDYRQRRRMEIDEAFREALRDKERAETVIRDGHIYPLTHLQSGDVLTQGRRYVHPFVKRIILA